MKRLCKLGTLCWAATHKRAPRGSLPECVCSPAPRSAGRCGRFQSCSRSRRANLKNDPISSATNELRPVAPRRDLSAKMGVHCVSTCSARARRVSGRTLQPNECRSQLLILWEAKQHSPSAHAPNAASKSTKRPFVSSTRPEAARRRLLSACRGNGDSRETGAAICDAIPTVRNRRPRSRPHFEHSG